MAKDPIVYQDGQWFFINEIQTDLHGPFASRQEAEETLRKYLKWLNSGKRKNESVSLRRQRLQR